MIGFIIWIIGFVLAIKAALEILNVNGDFVKKLIAIIVLLLTSWVGIVVYYFFAKDKMAEWLK